mgnify:CR=1 FL=1
MRAQILRNRFRAGIRQPRALMRQHFQVHVLPRCRLRSGRPLGAGAFIFTPNHFLVAIHYRGLKKPR